MVGVSGAGQGTARRIAQDAQHAAADPSVSAWVSASAGSGKTKLLTDRLLRLMLLPGADPAAILCLTFTRAAAAEMATRLAARLGEWASADDAALAGKLTELTRRPPDRAMLDRARGLFARVLDLPGGMRIQTIHAFCQTLLRRFPLEAAISPHFGLVEDREAAALKREAREATLGAEAAEDAAALLAPLVSADGFADVLQLIADRGGRFAAALRRHGGVAGLVAALRGAIGEAEDEDAILATACASVPDDLTRCAGALALGSVPEQEVSARMRAFLEGDAVLRASGWADWCGIFLTDKGEKRKKFGTKKSAAALPDLPALMEAEANRVLAVRARIRNARLAAASTALVALAAPYADDYETRKQRLAALDYDDLIRASVDLLAQPEIGGWILFKLDGGLDHLLIDEAQDTAPAQWRVAELLTADFFTGAGQHDRPRSVFAVGDPKQSIYGFQGADPAAFAQYGDSFAARARAIDADGFRNVPLNVSFRSAPTVLSLVDAVFAPDPVRAGVSPDPVIHRADREAAPGCVELWPLAPREAAPDAAPWDPPAARVVLRDAAARLADAIAGRIRTWLDTGERVRGRPMRPGDILILVRSRHGFVRRLVRALKTAAVPVAGLDRLTLTAELPVRDLIALIQVLLFPDDDLNLAALLKSPLVGLDEDALMHLALGRTGALRATLAARARERADWAAAEEWLADLLARADFVTPHALLAYVLAERGGRARMLARLGPEAAEPLDELMEAALAYERAHAPSLQGFLAWLEAGEAELKREPGAARDEVRIMTVHGAKGLEAPVVILPATIGSAGRADPVLWDGGLPFYAPHKDHQGDRYEGALAAARTRAEAEERRLLYVALTRAADRLLVCGWEKGRTAAEDWYGMIAAGFRLLNASEAPFDAGAWCGEAGWTGTALRIAREEDGAAPAVPAAAPVPPMPAHLRTPPPPEETPPRPLSPSRDPAAPATLPPGGVLDPNGARFRRGRLIHALLQHLPGLPPDTRAAAAARYLSAPGHGLGPGDAEEIAAEVLRLLDDPVFAPLFAPDALAEAPLAALLPGGRPVLGQADRIAVTAADVLVADFKTNRPPPARVADVAPLYLRQMAAYRAVLRQVWPDRTVRCALVWTHAPRLMELPDALLDRHAPLSQS